MTASLHTRPGGEIAMTRIAPDLLNDTLNLIQLARETARARGNQAQVDRLTPVADNLRNLVVTAQQPKAPSEPSGLMAQPDFRLLLEKIQSAPAPGARPAFSTDRNQMVQAMSASGMNDIEIARYTGMTRDEVHLILNVSASGNLSVSGSGNSSASEVSK
jgi:hypothetical protein